MARIMIVDDDHEIRQSLLLILKNAGYEVIGASNGEEALEAFKKTPSDLVITDIIMPEKNGIEMIFQFKCEHPGVKIIAISGGGMLLPQDYLNMARSAGVSHTFKKPFDPDKMLDAVKEILGQSDSTV